MKILDQILLLDNLRAAWVEVAEGGGAAGMDRVSIARWRRNWEERLVQLMYSVRRNTYRPYRPRWVYIPKSDGSLREISILTITDRVLQRAVLRVVDDIFDQTFLDCSYGYRAGRGVRDAVKAILLLRDAGFTRVLDADIDNCFLSLNHRLILDQFGASIDEPALLNLVRLWLNMGKSNQKDDTGILMGAVISPLLCNILLNQLDQRITAQGHHLIRYADDFCVFCADLHRLNLAAEAVEATLGDLRLRLEPQKTRLTSFEEGFTFLGVHFLGNSYRFNASQKTIVVEGDFDSQLFFDYIPEGYND